MGIGLNYNGQAYRKIFEGVKEAEEEAKEE